MMITNAIVPDQLGGLQRYVRELAASLAERDVEVTVVARRLSAGPACARARRRRREDPPLRRRRARPSSVRGPLPVSSVRAVAAAVRAHRGIVHVHYPAQGIAPALLNARYVHTFHAPAYKEVLPEQRNRYRLPPVARRPMVSAVRAAERLIASRSAATIVLTDYMREELAALSSLGGRPCGDHPGRHRPRGVLARTRNDHAICADRGSASVHGAAVGSAHRRPRAGSGDARDSRPPSRRPPGRRRRRPVARGYRGRHLAPAPRDSSACSAGYPSRTS